MNKQKQNYYIVAVIAGIIAATLLTISIVQIQQQEKQDKADFIKSTLQHKCSNLQKYYFDSGLDINLRCNNLVSALTD